MKTINNKQYEECSVVMLATDKAENCLLSSVIKGKLFYEKLYMTQEYLKSIDKQSYHLYILNDDEIKEGDWYYSKALDSVLQANILSLAAKDSKKIIATTDKSLITNLDTTEKEEDIYNLAFVPQSFIDYFVEQYNKGNVIDKVLVEYLYNPKGEYKQIYNTELVINPDNTINILTQKNSWSRDEVIELIKLSMIKSFKVGNKLFKNFDSTHIMYPHRNPNFYEDKMKEHCEFDKWISKNV